MTYDEFVEQVQQRGRLSSRAAAERATRVVLETVGERLAGGEPEDLAAQLPPEIGRYLLEPLAGAAVPYDSQDFYELVSQREGVDVQIAAHHVRAVAAVLRDAVSAGEWQDVLAQMPPDIDRLLGSGSEGQAPSL